MAGEKPVEMGKRVVPTEYGPLTVCRQCGKPVQWYRGPKCPSGRWISGETGNPHVYECDYQQRPVEVMMPNECGCGQVVYLDSRGRKWDDRTTRHLCPDLEPARQPGPPPREWPSRPKPVEDLGGVAV